MKHFLLPIDIHRKKLNIMEHFKIKPINRLKTVNIFFRN